MRQLRGSCRFHICKLLATNLCDYFPPLLQCDVKRLARLHCWGTRFPKARSFWLRRGQSTGILRTGVQTPLNSALRDA